MTTWHFAFLMPHTAFSEPIENEHVALVPPNDERLKDLASQHPAICKLTTKFSDQFHQTVTPSALLVRSDTPDTIGFHAVVGFRNIVAISSIIDAWCFQLIGGSNSYPLWSDYFDFYPFTETKDGNGLIAQSVASMEYNKPDSFSGQRAPHLPTSERLSFGVDRLVLNACSKQWHRRFVKQRKEWRTRVLFRSLEIAAQASRMPAVGTRSPTIFDAGVGIALWVSALEILSHPRSGKASLQTVLALLGGAEWKKAALKTLRYTVKNKGATMKVNYTQRLYAELYRARNDFLHGNPVTSGSLFPSRDRQQPLLLYCAPLVYRVALGSFLGIREPVVRGGSALSRTFEASLIYGLDRDKLEDAVEACQKNRVVSPRGSLAQR